MKKNKTITITILIIISFILVLINVKELHALKVDEKLPLRILKTSNTKKTILINRGTEDGLVVGDQARFFLTSGVVARGAVVKTSPSRSIWSIFRIINPKDIEVDKVMDLKITPPVKLTNDPTKMLTNQDILVSKPKGIALAEGADDLGPNLTPGEKKDFKKVKESLANMPEITDNLWEIWGLLQMTAMTTSNSVGTGQGSKGDEKVINIMIGGEKYFANFNSWYGMISFFPFFHYAKNNSNSLEGNSVGFSLKGIGLGLNYHFVNPPLIVRRFIFNTFITFGLGYVTDQSSFTEGTPYVHDYKGSYNALSLGGGMKYYFGEGFGARMIIDYYARAEKYAVEGEKDDYEKDVKGPRLLMGLSYRF